MVILCTKHTPRQALLIKSKISHSAFDERTVRDTSEIVIVTGHPVCKMDPPMAGGGLQLVCVNILGAGKVFMKLIYWASAAACLVNKIDWSIDTLCAWKLLPPRDMILALLKPTTFSPSEPCMCCEAGECFQ
jgi:hypothetical protein